MFNITIRDIVEDEKVSLQKIHTDDNVTFMLSEPVVREKFVWCKTSLGLVVI